MAWRRGLVPVVPANTAAFSPRGDLVQNSRAPSTHRLIYAQAAADADADAGSDACSDAGPDAGSDARSDAGPDARADASASA